MSTAINLQMTGEKPNKRRAREKSNEAISKLTSKKRERMHVNSNMKPLYRTNEHGDLLGGLIHGEELEI